MVLASCRTDLGIGVLSSCIAELVPTLLNPDCVVGESTAVVVRRKLLGEESGELID